MEKEKRWRGGRPPKAKDKQIYHYNFWLTETDNIIFEKRFNASGESNRTKFIVACLLSKPIEVAITDKGAMDVCVKLSEINTQIRLIGVNYNQATRAVKTAFVEKKALAFIYKLEKATFALSVLANKIVNITEDYKKRWLQK